MMSLDKEDLYERADWDGAAGTSRRRLLEKLQGELSIINSIGTTSRPFHSFHLAENYGASAQTRYSPRSSEASTSHVLSVSSRWRVNLVVYRSRVREWTIPNGDNSHVSGSYRRSLDDRMESRRDDAGERRQGANGGDMASEGE